MKSNFVTLKIDIFKKLHSCNDFLSNRANCFAANLAKYVNLQMKRLLHDLTEDRFV